MRAILFTFIATCALLSMAQSTSYAQTETTEDLFEMSIEDLMNQSVTTVSKSEEKILDAPGIISVLSKEEIAMFGGTTLASILERVPGLSLNSSSLSDRSIVTSRGEQISTTSHHILILLNGRPVRETLEGGVSSEMFESFPINAIERIEVIKGPGSVLYGSNAFSGVINIITQSAETTEVTLSAMGGIPGSYGASGNVKVNAGNFELLASGQYLQKPVWETEYDYLRTFAGQRDTEGNNTATRPGPQPGAGETMTPETRNVAILNTGVGAFVSAKYKKLKFSSSYNAWETMTFETPGNASWNKAFANLGYDIDFGDKWTSTINASYTNAKFETDSFPNIKRNSYELLTEWTHNVTLTDKAKLVFGGLYTYSKGNETNKNDESMGVEGHRYTYAGYAQADYQLLNSLKITAGMQAIKIEKVDLKFVPRAALVWNPNESLNFKALYSQAYRAPSLMELYIDQSFRLGNADLNPETVGTIDIGATYTNNKFQVGVNYFHSTLNDIISLEHNSSIPTYQNMGEVVFNGFEVEAKYYVNPKVYVTGSTLYQTNKDAQGTTNVSPTPNLSAKGGINFSTDNGISLGLFNVFQGALDESYESEFNTSPVTAFNKLSFNANFNATKLFNLNTTKDFAVFIQADNLLNQQIWSYTKTGQTNSSVPFNSGRTVYAGIKVKF